VIVAIPVVQPYTTLFCLRALKSILATASRVLPQAVTESGGSCVRLRASLSDHRLQGHSKQRLFGSETAAAAFSALISLLGDRIECVLFHNFRAIPVASRPAFLHHDSSSLQR
jgi:hypothetical protein